MPLVKKKLSVASGATSDQVLQGTTYEYVDPGTRIVVAAAVDTAGTAFADTTMDFTVNNAEFAKNASVSTLVTGEAFGDPDCIRISYAASEDDLRTAIARIKEALSKLF